MYSSRVPANVSLDTYKQIKYIFSYYFSPFIIQQVAYFKQFCAFLFFPTQHILEIFSYHTRWASSSTTSFFVPAAEYSIVYHTLYIWLISVFCFYKQCNQRFLIRDFWLKLCSFYSLEIPHTCVWLPKKCVLNLQKGRDGRGFRAGLVQRTILRKRKPKLLWSDLPKVTE